MSSAILYVAIVAIWACVLIPRWLRRSPAVPAPESSDTVTGQTESPVPSPGSRWLSPGVAESGLSAGVAESGAANWREPVPARVLAQAPDAREPDPEAPDDEPRRRAPLTREESRRRMLAARRRLLLLLVALEAAACTLPALGLAALWVVIPPSIMLVGYMLLLREASKADREQAARAAEAAARARARGRSRAAPTAAPATPRPGEYEDLGHGRDYAPGLAGKYTTSNAEEVIDFTDDYKRAVGD